MSWWGAELNDPRPPDPRDLDLGGATVTRAQRPRDTASRLRIVIAAVVVALAASGCAAPTQAAAGAGAPSAAGAAAPAPDAGTGTPPLAEACPSIDMVHAWGGIDWVEDSIQDGVDRVAECDYFSVPYDPSSPALVESRYIIMLSTWDTPADVQLDRVRTDAQSAGGEVADVDVAGFPGLRFVDGQGLSCQLIARTGDSSTALVVLADPADEMDDECAVAERLLAALVTQP
ncbi:hypothetical protein [Actinotalea ferrariae]|uniref:hypothetical protein n=1 Tax=Actinotalea ferrariae TaxID=1386098 RepID=UPI0012DF6D59|nr:hypothetical protein [Actinotalea ferrariae]